jgi:DNA-binding MarR family transcriptional regulator
MPTPIRTARARQVAERLHSVSIHLLRRVRRQDDASGVSAPHLSALSVLVFGGPCTLGELAVAEQVKPPSITRIVRNLEAEGMVERQPDAGDGRVVRVRATEQGSRILHEARARRVADLARSLAELTDGDMVALERAADVLEEILRA